MNIQSLNAALLGQVLHLKKESETSSRKQSALAEKIQAIEELTRENTLLRDRLEKLKVRVAVETQPILMEYCETRMINLEILEDYLGNGYFKRREKEQIILLLIEGAAEISQLGDSRADRILRDYLPQPEKEPKASFTFERDEKTTAFEEADAAPVKEKSTLEIKDLYRRLVKFFHPDKEMDQDLKEEKNILMREVIEAYERNDFYELLRMEARYLGEKETSEDKLSIYLRELSEQLQRLKVEKSMLTKWGPLSIIYKTIYSRNPQKVEAKIRAHKEDLKSHILREEACFSVYSDPQCLKAYLRELAGQAEDLRDD